MSELRTEIAQMGKGIGNENRFSILQVLMENALTVGEIARQVGMSQSCVSQHLKVLKTSQLVSSTRRGQEILYNVNVAYMALLLKKLAMELPEKD